MKNILSVQKTHEAVDYPYGFRLRTSAFYSTEFNKKGFRNIFQTLNPKTGKMNAPKKGNYYHFAYHYLNTENNHIENAVLRFSGYESVNSGCKFLAENYEALELNAEMVKEICAYMFTAVRVSATFTSAETKSLLAIIDAPVKKLLHGFKTGENVFSEVFIDTEAIKSLEASYTGEPAVKFTVVNYGVQ